MINNLKELFDATCFSEACAEEEMKKRIERNVYKYNSCGPWISFAESGITLGSIVEGCDYGATPIGLQYPFDYEEFDQALVYIGEEVDEIWNATHGCDDCFPGIDFDSNPVDRHCKSCFGEGVPI